MTFNDKQREYERIQLQKIEDDDYFCEYCGEEIVACLCEHEHEEPDFEPDDYCSDFDADMAADRYFGDY